MQNKKLTGLVLIGVMLLMLLVANPTHATMPPIRQDGGNGFSTQPQVASGDYFTCGLNTAGTVQCWGYNAFGVLGVNPLAVESSHTPLTIAGVTNAVAISVGVYHACALINNGTILCWGGNQNGQSGNGTFDDSPTPTQVTGITSAVAISAGTYHTCAVLADGNLQCWGENEDLQLGTNSVSQSDTPLTVAGLGTVAGVAAGGAHTCALMAIGTVNCWGWNGHGQLGDGTFTGRHTPAAVGGINQAKAVAAGQSHACALLTNGEVRCWGWNDIGQLGNGSFSDSNVIVIPNIENVTSIDLGFYHSCARLADGTMQCWGANGSGQLGNGEDETAENEPVEVTGLNGVVQVGAGRTHTCAVVSDGNISCWGDNGDGHLGTGDTTAHTTPTATLFTSATAPVALAAGMNHVCVLISNGMVRCWGSNGHNQLGVSGGDQTQPVTVTGLTNVVALAAGVSHTCALLDNGTMRCWGANTVGQLGLGHVMPIATPTLLDTIENIQAITAGNNHTCALHADGSATCWGNNTFGQVGNGTSANVLNAPVFVSSFAQGIAIEAGASHTCALVGGGSARCWGINTEGQLGNGNAPTGASSPVNVVGLAGAVSLESGTNHNCAVVADGTVQCWGQDNGGQLGQGGAIPGVTRDEPITVGGVTTAVSVAAGGDHTCVRLANGAAQCWGLNTSGQLGNNSLVSSSSPVNVTGAVNVLAIEAGMFFTCARFGMTDIYCWGSNSNGQVGHSSVGSNIQTPWLVENLTASLFGVYLPILIR